MTGRNPMTPAERARRHRALEREGRCIVRAPVREHVLVDALIESHRLSEDDASDAEKVAKAAAAVLDDWAAEIISRFRHA